MTVENNKQDPNDPKDPRTIQKMADDPVIKESSRVLFNKSCEFNYSYNFKWLGRPIIQFPQDVMAMQEIVWQTRPDVIVETGIAHGGSLILSASLLQMLGGDGKVVGVDIDIREHNRKAIEEHPLADRITLIQGSATEDSTVTMVRDAVGDAKRVMVVLDSNHTREHVAAELEKYSPMVTEGCYLIVFDTVIEYMEEDAFPDRPWGKGDNPLTAVHDFLSVNSDFTIDREICDKLLLTVAPDGYLQRVK